MGKRNNPEVHPDDDDPVGETGLSPVSRRQLFGAAMGVTAAATMPSLISPAAARTSKPSGKTAPFNSMRDYVAAMDDWGLVMRIPKVNQDEYEATALMYRVRDQFGMRGAPALLFDKVKIDGRWVDGPLLVNESGSSHAECLAFGLDPVDEGPIHTEPLNSYRKARNYVEQMIADNDGEYPTIPPVEVAAGDAPCKDVVLEGDDIDLTKFQFIQCNPADAGRYINTGVVFTRHAKRGVNFGTYRCHLRGPREIAINSEPGQTGWNHLQAAKRRGETTAKVSIALTPDPYVWMVSGNKMSFGKGRLLDEMSVAGGIAGRPVEVVKCETNDFMVPAHAEMIIEGEVPLNDMRPEGPYGEFVGYQGDVKPKAFWMKVTRVTHRKNPWLMNNFTGQQAGALMAAGNALSSYKIKREIRAVQEIFSDTRAVGFFYVSIKKTEPGQGLKVAKQITEKFFNAKIVVVVDDDIDIVDKDAMMSAMGARWQPWGNTEVYESLPALPLDPSTPTVGKSSKIAIDATKQWPEEGGPEVFPERNEVLLKQGAPDAFSRVDEQWGEQIRAWRETLPKA